MYSSQLADSYIIMTNKNPFPDWVKTLWHPTKNVLPFESLSAGSGKKVWWVCDNGHEWEAQFRSVVSGHSCPYCSGNKVWVGFNDLATMQPELVKQWSSENAIKPETVVRGTRQKVKWVCSEGHKWEATVLSRAVNGTGCPYCAGQKVWIGFNDLATTQPELAEEWDFTKNAKSPQQITSGINAKFWWLCKRGHSYDAYLGERKQGAGCYYCNNAKILPGFNDLGTVEPELFKLLDLNKNSGQGLTNISPKSLSKMWFICDEGHSVLLRVTDAVKRYHNEGVPPCNFCNGTRILTGFNNLAITHPYLIDEWDKNKNDVQVSSVSRGSSGKFWWLCDKKHSFSARIGDRVNGSKCNICSNYAVLAGLNDMATTNPLMAAEWHPTKNGELRTENITDGSNTKVWWLCEKGHEWFNSPLSRKKADGSVSKCMECHSQTFSSKPEKEIANMFEALGVKIICNSRKLLKGTELDIYLPEYKVAVEYNGLYWHTEARKGKNYHYDKWRKCEELGIQLIQIWEDSWVKDKNLVLRSLQHKVGFASQERIFARKTSVKEVSAREAKPFLLANHIQGFASGSYYFGLFDVTGVMCSLIVLKREPNNGLNIIRYATSAQVVGGFTKLLAYAEKQNEPDFFVTFSDHCISDGSLYSRNGFTADQEIGPDYMYVVGLERKHKFGYRLKKFRESPDLQYVEGYSESQLARLNDLERIWDAGKTRWVKQVS